MDYKNLNSLTKTELNLFDKIAKAYAYLNIPILMADYAIQRGGILSEFVSHGGKAYMAGGKDGQQFFKNVPQFTLNYDTFCNRNLGVIKDIVSRFPKFIVSENYATFCYVPMGNNLWQKNIQAHLGGNIVATSEQNLRSYFEEKVNLTHILKTAGLEKNIIPSAIIKGAEPLSEMECYAIYDRLKSKDGKIVIQRCGEGNTEVGGGKSTEIVENLKDFIKIVNAKRECSLKVAKYIDGCNSNLSLCVGNTLPSSTMLGAVKGEIKDDENPFSYQTLFNLLNRGKEMGLNLNNIVVNVHPATLKVVGCKELTSEETNGVGNQLNYNFSPEILEEIYNIGNKLGKVMALCGRVGMCGLDLIITKEGKVYINELNDRQQGPTESASLNNEANGLPGIHRESFIMNFADLKSPEVVDYLKQMNESSKEIYYASTKIPSPFYIKVMAKEECFSKQTLSPGDYAVSKLNENEYNWNLTDNWNLPSTPNVNVNDDSFIVRIDTVSAKEDDFIPKGTQFLRINGIASPGNEPFAIDENGISILTEQWKAPIESLYNQTMQKEQPFDLQTNLEQNNNLEEN